MRYFIRELYYFFVAIYMKIKNRKLFVGFRAKMDPNSKFEGYNKIEHHSYFRGQMGRCSYIGECSHVVGKIGRFCSIAGNVNFVTLTHPTDCFVSTSPCFYSTKKQSGLSYVDKDKFNESPTIQGEDDSIIVGNDVYIGFGATIIGPVKIGDGAVIAANATVVNDVEPYSIVGGVPAKLIRYRFNAQQIEKLKKVQWWNQTDEWLESHSYLFENIDRFDTEFEIK